MHAETGLIGVGWGRGGVGEGVLDLGKLLCSAPLETAAGSRSRAELGGAEQSRAGRSRAELGGAGP